MTRDLDTIRRQIDELDDRILDLLLERFALGAQVLAAKGGPAGQPVIRPDREAAIMRRLVSRWHGPVNPATGITLWREIIAAVLRLQAPLTVHLADGEPEGLRDVARASYGALTPIQRHASALAVIQACAKDPTGVGVLAVPDTEDIGQPWWSHLRDSQSRPVRIFARLPFAIGVITAHWPQAYVLAPIAPPNTGDDVSVFSIALEHALSRTRLLEAFQAEGLLARFVGSKRENELVPPHLYLLEIEGFHGIEAPSVKAALDKLSADGVTAAYAGGYARPIALAPL